MKKNNVIEFTGVANNKGNTHTTFNFDKDLNPDAMIYFLDTMSARMKELKSSLILKKILDKAHA